MVAEGPSPEPQEAVVVAVELDQPDLSEPQRQGLEAHPASSEQPQSPEESEATAREDRSPLSLHTTENGAVVVVEDTPLRLRHARADLRSLAVVEAVTVAERLRLVQQ